MEPPWSRECQVWMYQNEHIFISPFLSPSLSGQIHIVNGSQLAKMKKSIPDMSLP